MARVVVVRHCLFDCISLRLKSRAFLQRIMLYTCCNEAYRAEPISTSVDAPRNPPMVSLLRAT